jgi:hypothetical protein
VDVPKSQKRDRQGHGTLYQPLDGAALLADKMDLTLRVNLSRDDEAELNVLYEALLRTIDFAIVRLLECGRGLCSTVRNF